MNLLFLEKLPAFRAAAGLSGRPNRAAAYGAAIVLCVFASLARTVVDHWLPPGFPFLTYFPAVVVTAFVFGTAPGVFSAVLCGLASWYLFIPPRMSFNVDLGSVVAVAFYMLVVAIDLALIHLAIHAYGQQSRLRAQLAYAIESRDIVEREADHRVKNLFAVIQSLIRLASRQASSPGALADDLLQRISAMGTSYGRLKGMAAPDDRTLHSIVEASLLPFANLERLSLAGPDARLAPNAAMAVSLVIHELGTNATKYGALRTPDGTLSVVWSREQAGDMVLDWQERGEIAGMAPSSTGFGTSLIDRLLKGLDGTMQRTFHPSGLSARLTIGAAAFE